MEVSWLTNHILYAIFGCFSKNQKRMLKMSLCPVCGRVYCDHSPEERGQTSEEMMRPLSEEEQKVWEEESSDSPKKIAVAKKHAHDHPV
ncbi:hypothetical protein A2V71_03455 [Candidatus Berkelbacteria bacterium RBG_13_40_8]|uniref:Uncharacterized protein n=1 Tax=Candidatus Berkelbacteria bacterium RBG_13_40_8 TaxID=1797467 RepID=A0A1F5DQK8_9BACT|nr:MAG: hypothetical protein A2V71_03455 [Candidatus Berkelbacteria bacterium RBG_13_40_8]